MTSNGISGPGSPAARAEMNPKKRAILEAGVVLIAVGVLLLITGRPYSNWFYAVVGTVFISGIYRAMTGQHRQALPSDPPRDVAAALKEALLQGISAGLFFFAFIYTASGELHQWPAAIFFGVFLGLQFYVLQRGHKPSLKVLLGPPMGLVGVALLVVLWKKLTH